MAAPPSDREGKKNFQAWISAEAFEDINAWCRATGVTRTAWLEAMAEWMHDHPYTPGKFSTQDGRSFILRARQITAESRERRRNE